MSLDIRDLQKVHEERQKKHLRLYDTIFQKCSNKIKYTNNKLYKQNCIFEVPTVMWGLPIYNLKQCVVYLMVKLRSLGFITKYCHPNYLFISWSKQQNNSNNTNSNNLLEYKSNNNLTPQPIGTGVDNFELF